jgi:uncharacterized integral membrane protein
MSTPGQPTGRSDHGPAGVQPGQVPAQPGPADPTTSPGRKPRQRGGGVSWPLYLVTVVLLVVAILVVIFVIENQRSTTVWWFSGRQTMSVAEALSLAALGGFVVGLLVGLLASVRVRRRLRAARRRPG